MGTSSVGCAGTEPQALIAPRASTGGTRSDILFSLELCEFKAKTKSSLTNVCPGISRAAGPGSGLWTTGAVFFQEGNLPLNAVGGT